MDNFSIRLRYTKHINYWFQNRESGSTADLDMSAKRGKARQNRRAQVCGPVKKKYKCLGPSGKGGRLKMFILNRRDRKLQSDLGLV
jgi:hypothetical protein